MKRYLLSVLIGVGAMVVLSGCNGEETSVSGTISSVDIKELKNGYIISGYDAVNSRSVKYAFCGKYYDYYRDGDSTQSGHFSIADSDRYTESRINMWMNDGKTSYRIDVDNDNEDGLLIVGHEYELIKQHEYIQVQKIQRDKDCL